MLNNDNITPQERMDIQANVAPSYPRGEKFFSLPVVPLHFRHWHPLVETTMQRDAAALLERGNVLFLPHLPFTLTRQEETFLRPDCASPRTRSVGFSWKTQHIWGLADKEENTLTPSALLKRYAEATYDFVARLFPGYISRLTIGDTRLRPMAVKQGSRQPGEHLLHIDAFRAHPSRGARVLRIATNVNPGGFARTLTLGEPFPNLLARFRPQLKNPVPGAALLSQLLLRTRGKSAPYDHYMLQLRQAMERDAVYQAEGPQANISFPSGSSWIMFSDQVPHRSVSGQFLLEQVFWISPESLDDPSTAPLFAMERLMRRKLAPEWPRAATPGVLPQV